MERMKNESYEVIVALLGTFLKHEEILDVFLQIVKKILAIRIITYSNQEKTIKP